MIGVLPELWTAVKFSDICRINPRGRPELGEDDDVSFVPMAAVSEFSGTIVGAEMRKLKDVQKGFTPFQEGDVLLAKITPCMENGKAAIARNLINQHGYGSTEFHVLRPSALVLAEWVFAIIRTTEFRRAAASSFQGAVGQQRVTTSFLERFRIPLPPLSEQKRIVEIMQEIEAVRRLRSETEAKSSSLVPALFDGVFGSPSEWKGGPKLSELVRIVGGGTPSRRVEHFYSGSISWATSKDIKKLYLDDTEEHVSEQAVQASSTNVVPVGTVLVVVKSKILAHSLPVAITQVPMCFGQDIKGLIPLVGITPEFLVYALQAQLGRILSRARGANTEGLTLEALKSLDMPKPTQQRINRFQIACGEIRAVVDATILGNRTQAMTIASLSAHAFSGKLTEKWREANEDTLVIEVAARDTALSQVRDKLSHTRRRTIQEDDRLSELRTDGVYSDLNREQRGLIVRIQKQFGRQKGASYFSAQSLSHSMEGPLRRNPQAIEGHLAVFAARGLIIPVSREEQSMDTGEFMFGNAFRLPIEDNPYLISDQAGNKFSVESGELVEVEGLLGDRNRGNELERLATQLEKERALK